MSPIAIVTGAGSGIGRAIAVRLAKDGYAIMLVGRRADPLERTRERLVDLADTPHKVVPGDLADPQQVRDVVGSTLGLHGRIDVLVNNAAICEAAPIEECDAGLFERTLAANLIGPALLVAGLWRSFVAWGGGCVVNVSSIATIDPFPSLCAYAASKAGLESLTRSIVNEGTHHGIRGYSVAPGAVETDMLRSLISFELLPREATLAPERVAEVVAQCVAGRREPDASRTIVLRSE